MEKRKNLPIYLDSAKVQATSKYFFQNLLALSVSGYVARIILQFLTVSFPKILVSFFLSLQFCFFLLALVDFPIFSYFRWIFELLNGVHDSSLAKKGLTVFLCPWLLFGIISRISLIFQKKASKREKGKVKLDKSEKSPTKSPTIPIMSYLCINMEIVFLKEIFSMNPLCLCILFKYWGNITLNCLV